jgi:hypothetical protein
MEIFSSVTNFISNSPWYLLFFLAVLSGGFFWGAYRGKHNLKGTILALYVSAVLFPLLPLQGFLNDRPLREIFLVEISVFLTLWIFLAFLITRRYLAEDSDGIWWEVMLLSILVLTLLITVTIGILPAELVNAELLGVPDYLLNIFSDPNLARWFLIAPILGVILL